jgi:hypothetical protein
MTTFRSKTHFVGFLLVESPSSERRRASFHLCGDAPISWPSDFARSKVGVCRWLDRSDECKHGSIAAEMSMVSLTGQGTVTTGCFEPRVIPLGNQFTPEALEAPPPDFCISSCICRTLWPLSVGVHRVTGMLLPTGISRWQVCRATCASGALAAGICALTLESMG